MEDKKKSVWRIIIRRPLRLHGPSLFISLHTNAYKNTPIYCSNYTYTYLQNL